MKKEEVMNLPGDNRLCGVQVSGEDEHRWIDCDELTASTGGALRQDGAPNIPPLSSDMVQKMLAMDWAIRGGC